MTNSPSPQLLNDTKTESLGAALWRAKGRIIVLPLIAGALTFVALSMMQPFYTSEARVLVQIAAPAFTHPADKVDGALDRAAVDEHSLQSQVQVLKSRNLVLGVVKDLSLNENAAFLRDAGAKPIDRLLNTLGLNYVGEGSPQERAASTLARHLDVHQLPSSSVLSIEYSSGDPTLAAEIANKLADDYVAWARDAKIAQAKDASDWLDAEIGALRKATAESEAALELFKASEGSYEGSNESTLTAAQLTELNSQLILAKAERSEAELRAKLAKQMLAEIGDIDATPEALKSQVVVTLIEQRLSVQRKLTEQSATLLPSHPRIQQLRSELADVRAQLRTEAEKVVKSLENQAEIAAARESSLRASLENAGSRTAPQSSARAERRALEREAKANRDLLDSYLARNHDVSSGDDIGVVPSQVAIVSRAQASVLPSSPRRGPIALLVALITALLAVASVLAKTIIERGGARSAKQSAGNLSAAMAVTHAREQVLPQDTPVRSGVPGRDRMRSANAEGSAQRRSKKHLQKSSLRAAEPAKHPSRPALNERRSASLDNSKSRRPARVASKNVGGSKQASPLRKAVVSNRSATTARAEVNPNTKTKSAREKQPAAPERKGILAALAAPATAATSRAESGAEAASAAREANLRSIPPETVETENTAQGDLMSTVTTENAQSASSKDLIRRFRQDANRQTEVQRVANEPMRRSSGPRHTEYRNGDRALRPNDLRHYLTQRVPASSTEAHSQEPADLRPRVEELGPAIASLDEVTDTILDISTGGAPRTLLVAGMSVRAQSAHAAIGIARNLAGRNAQAALVDLAKGSVVVSEQLNMPRVPGFSDLAEGAVDFAGVIKVDAEMTLQIIPAGSPNLNIGLDAPDKFMRVFEALTQTYDCVVLHADMAGIESLMPALKFELPVAVAVLPPKTAPEDAEESLSIVQRLGCPVVVHGDSVARGGRGFSLFGGRRAV